MAGKKKRGRGRPKGSTSRGVTVPLGFRVPKDLYDEIEAIRTRAEVVESKTRILEQLLRKGIAAQRGPKRSTR